MDELLMRLNSGSEASRLAASLEVGEKIASGELPRRQTQEVNNHVHTTYSFSPYHPSMAVFKAWEAGLLAVGSMDHDSVGAAGETIRAAANIGIASTVGVEVRVNFTGTPMEGKKINNPDMANVVYIAIHGIPHQHLPEVATFLQPINKARNLRNAAMVEKLNDLTAEYGIKPIDFERDVVDASQASFGGAITERHILYALVVKIIEARGKGDRVLNFLKTDLGLTLPEKIEGFLSDTGNPHYEYDLLGILKSNFLPKFYLLPNDDECVPVKEVVDLANKIHAIPVYAYLGDVAESPTGDKKAEKFEDDFLDELIQVIKNLGFKAVTYMPPRNNKAQIKRIQELCGKFDLMEISGVDINSSRQSFNCPEILEPECRHLVDNTWALIAHEKLASQNIRYAMFNPENPYAELPLKERIALYAQFGQKIDPKHPEKAQDVLTGINK